MTDIADGDIESVGLSGDGLARLGRRQLAVPFTIPGERVRVRLIEEHKQFARGALLQVITSSPDRVEPPCPLFRDRPTAIHPCASAAAGRPIG